MEKQVVTEVTPPKASRPCLVCLNMLFPLQFRVWVQLFLANNTSFRVWFYCGTVEANFLIFCSLFERILRTWINGSLRQRRSCKRIISKLKMVNILLIIYSSYGNCTEYMHPNMFVYTKEHGCTLFFIAIFHSLLLIFSQYDFLLNSEHLHLSTILFLFI